MDDRFSTARSVIAWVSVSGYPLLRRLCRSTRVRNSRLSRLYILLLAWALAGLTCWLPIASHR